MRAPLIAALLAGLLLADATSPWDPDVEFTWVHSVESWTFGDHLWAQAQWGASLWMDAST
eukprot:gene1130-6447_t